MTIRPRHYARLFMLDASNEQLSTRLTELRALSSVTRRLGQFAAMHARTNELQDLLQELKLDALVVTVVNELATTGKLSWLPSISRTLESMLVAKKLPVPIQVSLAHDVVDATALKTALEPILGSISTVEITVDPTQLGGIDVKVADQALNTRLDDRLKKLRLSLRERN